MERKLSEMEEELKVTYQSFLNIVVADTNTTHYIYVSANISWFDKYGITVSLSSLNLNRSGGRQDSWNRQKRRDNNKIDMLVFVL